jgi:arylformamidase
MASLLRPTTWLLPAALSALAAMLLPAPAGAAYTTESDMPYVANGSPLQRLDIYKPSPAPTGPAPVVLYVHGGGWAIGDKSNRMPDKARLFTDAGYLFISTNYRLSPNPPDLADANRIRFPVHPADVTAALRWIRGVISSRGGDPSRIVLIGHSAGAQIVTLLGADGGFLRARGVDPLSIRGIVSLDTTLFDISEDADPAKNTRNARARILLWNAFATPSENAADGTWERASALGKGDRNDPPGLFVTQNNPKRIAVNETMAADLNLDPAHAVLGVPLDHEGINTALGSPTDTTGETAAVLEFVRSAFAVEGAPATRLMKKPKKRSKLGKGKRKRVAFRFGSADPRATYRCRIDGRRWKPCASPRNFRLKRGRHRFRVRAVTRDGKGAIRKYGFRIATGSA